MDLFDFDLGEGFFRKLFRVIGRIVLFLLEIIVDLFTFWWEPPDRREQRKERRRQRRSDHPTKRSD